MNVKVLIDAIMRQTTVLIAQLATAAGVRAPLAHVADQVFLSLAREIEAQGVGKKVVADMFGMALRSYQRKIQRISSSPGTQGKTLFEAVLEYVQHHAGAGRAQVLQRFERDGERETIGVLTDLVASGLLYATGTGSDTLYGLTSDLERQRLTRQVEHSALCDMAWGQVYRTPGMTPTDLAEALGCDLEHIEAVLDELTRDGRVQATGAGSERTLHAATFQIPLGAGHGWESAVFDHFQALATAIANKVVLRNSPADMDGLLGGSTLRFELHDAHPYRNEALRLLERVRTESFELWNRISDYNDAHPAEASTRFNLCFYFGQTLDDVERSLHAQATNEPSHDA